MKRIFLFCLLLVGLGLLGCGKDANTGKQYTTLPDRSPVFKVKLDLKIAVDDQLSLYYTTDGSTDFSHHQPIWAIVKGNPKKQQIEFALPAKVRPSQLRIDLGRNTDQQSIYLSKVTLSYKGKAVELPGTLVFSYFVPDFTKTQFDATTGMVRGIVKNGVRQSPSLYPKEGPLENELEKLFEQ
jgi:hypothetical protein